MSKINFKQGFNEAEGHTVASSSYLEGNKIHIVKIKEAKEEKIKSKDNKEFNCITIVFEDEKGLIFEDRNFEVTVENTERKSNAFGGLNPSLLDSTMLKFRCYIENFAPKFNEKLIKGEIDLNMDTWKDVTNSMVSLLSAVAKLKNPVWCKLKLIKNKDGFASIPFFAAINKEGTAYIKNNFLGNVNILEKTNRDITFSSAEMKKINAEKEGVNNATTKDDLPASDNSDLTNIDDSDFEDMEL